MPNAANDEVMAWYHGWEEAKKDGEWESDEVRLQISNGYNQLMEIKFNQVKNLMEAAPVLKNKASIKKITPQDVKEWMQMGRVFCLKRQIYWKTFSKYMITKNTLNDDILEGVRTRMMAKVFNTQAPWIVTVYFEKIILEMLPLKERFDEIEARLIEKHVRTLQKEETTTQLRAEL